MNTKFYLAFDKNIRDSANKLLAYVFLEDGTCLNLELIKAGYAKTNIWINFKFKDEFKMYE
jgi:micrococcal nuclease